MTDNNEVLFHIGKKYENDKITHHGYHRFYCDYLDSNAKKIIEIGVDEKRGINLWLKYCPQSTVYGLDINVSYNDDRVWILKGDQSNDDDLNSLIQLVGNDVDFIIDDGSHIPEHQIFTFITLFKTLKPGGVYVIEDIETSYWSRNGLYGYNTRYGARHEWNVINVFNDVLHLLNREFLPTNDENIYKIVSKIPPKVVDEISTITFCHNCIIIKKKKLNEYQYLNRKYRFSENL